MNKINKCNNNNNDNCIKLIVVFYMLKKNQDLEMY